ncbi:mycofactocin oligosaccharide methyltransferase MftM [Nocardia veterana]|uniref:Class I SAM-dependent methyltransferase n=1 Tax=Nocardia veterana TaxID=132249 RepID=A0A7X6M3D2_9NOCA|nr:mycofactocin oligosaccharide methyltransferase MftM [Nocardia veterana]NKY89598.1 class I SAM-dependent methyltransferase [Nocardia veterana]
MNDPTATAPLHAFAPLSGNYYDDGVVRVGADYSDSGPGLRTESFRVRVVDHRSEITHRFRPQELDNGIAGLIADELFRTGLLAGADIFERVFLGVVRTTVAGAIPAWSTFYRNTIDSIHRYLAGAPEPRQTMAPVYERALQLVHPGRVLDLGSCFGFFPLLLAQSGHRVLASDVVAGNMQLLSRMAPLLGTPLDTLTCDATAVPLPARCVSTVTVLHLLEHLAPEEGRAVIGEATRLAAHRVVVAVPFETEPDPGYGHVRTFDLEELAVLGIETGLPFTVSEYHGGWLVLDVS